MYSVAKDRGWFKTYTPFSSTVDVAPLISRTPMHIPVLGIGTVEIPVKRSPSRTGQSAQGTLLLREVLHVPDCFCNFIGNPLILDNGWTWTFGGGAKSKGAIKDDQGKNIAYFDPKNPLFAIKLRYPPDGPKTGKTVFKKDDMYMLACRWDASEERKWQDFKAKNEVTGTAAKSDDREDKDEDEGAETEFEAHQADLIFTASQLEWIEKHYGNSDHFMKCFGLKFHKEGDLEDAKATVEVMMSDDD